MPTFLFTYRVPPQPMDEAMAELDDAAGSPLRRLDRWFESLGSSVVEIGNPVSEPRRSARRPAPGSAGTR